MHFLYKVFRWSENAILKIVYFIIYPYDFDAFESDRLQECRKSPSSGKLP